ncbi:prephenate dehydratase [Mucisphaera calidilacus]|uniref:Bifunctional chorismate mutase/prephenate dehydratase n=1 Tax=Mucisphaera calidilacus TaxID=2527982 RepID=A0A518BWD4_9BACT|nr:prephenate dehydratase [Mucisphaera calidilacus]QDU71292.1 P-protein [Mucisphaera calidilacus]
MTDSLDAQNDSRALEEGLAPLREQIDGLDRELVELLNRRAEVVVEVGKLKRDKGGAIYAPDREQRVLERVRALNEGRLLPDTCIEAIWREMMSGSFALERPLRIGYLGPPGTFSHLAARRKFGASVEYDNLADIPLIFEAVDRGDIDYGLVPIENSTEGFVTPSLDGLMNTRSRVCAEVLLPIHNNLLANCDAPDIKVIYSHPQPLAQCRRWLSAQFPQVPRVATTSTSKAAEQAAEEPGAAAIGTTLAAQIYGLAIQFENIEDSGENTTRFYVMARQETGPTGDDKTAIYFTTKHRSGALADVLDVFRDEGINLTHIDKRPSQRKNWDYVFFVDLLGHISDPHVSKALSEAAEHCLELRVLGSFPRATQPL